MNEEVTIHGDVWRLSDIQEAIEFVRELKLTKKVWQPRAALVSSGKTSEYVGQKFNPEYTKLVKDGWTHDHCEICWWSLHESDNPENGEGFADQDSRTWVCTECYVQFVEN